MGSDATRTILVGDVHGCLDELEALLAACDVQRGDRLVFVGDLVAKGPDSEGVVELARERGALCVRGNHDEAVLGYVRAKREDETLPRIKREHVELGDALPQSCLDYLEQMPYFLELADLNVWVVHAGIIPGRPLAEQRPIDLLNMRTLKPSGKPSPRLEDGTPWAKAHQGPSHVVFGHDAITGLQEEAFATGLDTGCVYGRKLTALVLPERKLVQVDAKRTYREIRV